MLIDTTFDFRTDAGGKDPDQHSPTLRRYHRLLWSKRLPDGSLFTLQEAPRPRYLHHHSVKGEFRLASDGIVQTFTRWRRPDVRRLMEQFPQAELDAFQTEGYTIGGFLVFPGNMVGGKQTINVMRGWNAQIRDRIDLTLECIRLQYLGQRNPLEATLSRYREFFALFETFRHYVDFFLLHDLVSADGSHVEMFLPLDFNADGLPKTVEEYVRYREQMLGLIRARNGRIEEFAKTQL
jgi:hypothetical protein